MDILYITYALISLGVCLGFIIKGKKPRLYHLTLSLGWPIIVGAMLATKFLDDGK